MLQDIPSEQTPKSLDNKHSERRENPSIKRNSKKSLKAQKANLASPYNTELTGFSGSNSLTPQAFASEHGRPNITIQFSETTSPANALRLTLPSVQSPSNYTVVQPNYGSGFTGTRPSYNGFLVRYGNHESAGRGDSSSMNNNSRNPVKSSKRNLEFTGTNGWPS
ncbi:unnamed protein product [Microthlaspi erraticum]|uniref:Uncharacterized protein n=1 Tax=Microthlaspi erraticum TaxID=1685480 RepID=A0A6D2L858_9BRAS|nr:unnamed protein product [Microthlaspi erraticum]